MSTGLAPRWASAPGETIRAILVERQLSIDYLAAALEAPLNEAEALLAGQATISAERAAQLSRALGASARFWLTREAEYAEDRTRVEAADWSGSLPLASMRRLGWIRATRDWRDEIDQCLGFFGVDDFEEWLDRYPKQTQNARYRTSTAHPNDDNATLVWFRAGDVEAGRSRPGRTFDAGALRKSVPALRALTRIGDPERFIPDLKRFTARCGLTVVVVPAPEGCRASGATRWENGTPIVQLSARYLSDDHFWFTFFHELGHVLAQDQRHQTYVDIDLDSGTHDHAESEADEFAESALLGGARLAEVRHDTPRNVVRTAVRLGVSPGILVGQLQHREILGREQLNGLKRRYRWEGERLVAK